MCTNFEGAYTASLAFGKGKFLFQTRAKTLQYFIKVERAHTSTIRNKCTKDGGNNQDVPQLCFATNTMPMAYWSELASARTDCTTDRLNFYIKHLTSGRPGAACYAAT